MFRGCDHCTVDSGLDAASVLEMIEQNNAPYVQNAVTCPAGWTLYTGTNKCYKMTAKKAGWAMGEANCQELQPGSHMASFHSKDEATWMGNTFKISGTLHSWIGLNKKSGDWAWLDGSPMDFSYWDSGYPAAITTPDNTCCEIYYGLLSGLLGTKIGQADNYDCTEEITTICKYDPVQGDNDASASSTDHYYNSNDYHNDAYHYFYNHDNSYHDSYHYYSNYYDAYNDSYNNHDTDDYHHHAYNYFYNSDNYHHHAYNHFYNSNNYYHVYHYNSDDYNHHKAHNHHGRANDNKSKV
ncbi:unnamed protein product [Caenorhabditis auriculariae]|uniref:C-type lectin domain-containing protein n=1 Tax=Caenorhabditis auriculariae TaxID=2777116 RepID=A0A8S1HU16_9PELO|nr:unnamed protein product [Caenorhabditis auriculariae]